MRLPGAFHAALLTCVILFPCHPERQRRMTWEEDDMGSRFSSSRLKNWWSNVLESMPAARASTGASIEAQGDACWVPLWSLAVGCVKMLAHR
jgi:hypothetical protein